MLNWKYLNTNIERIAKKRALSVGMSIYDGQRLVIALESYKREKRNYG